MDTQPESPEYKAACKLWDLYLRTRNEFVQKGEADDEDDDEDGQDNPGTEGVSVHVAAWIAWEVGITNFSGLLWEVVLVVERVSEH